MHCINWCSHNTRTEGCWSSSAQVSVSQARVKRRNVSKKERKRSQGKHSSRLAADSQQNASETVTEGEREKWTGMACASVSGSLTVSLRESAKERRASESKWSGRERETEERRGESKKHSCVRSCMRTANNFLAPSLHQRVCLCVSAATTRHCVCLSLFPASLSLSLHCTH